MLNALSFEIEFCLFVTKVSYLNRILIISFHIEVYQSDTLHQRNWLTIKYAKTSLQITLRPSTLSILSGQKGTLLHIAFKEILHLKKRTLSLFKESNPVYLRHFQPPRFNTDKTPAWHIVLGEVHDFSQPITGRLQSRSFLLAIFTIFVSC